MMQFETLYVNYILDVALLLNDTDTIARCIDMKKKKLYCQYVFLTQKERKIIVFKSSFFTESPTFEKHTFLSITPINYGINTQIKSCGKVISLSLEDSKTRLHAFFISKILISNTRLRFDPKKS